MSSNSYLQDFEHFMKMRLDASTAFVEGDFEPLKQISVKQSPATIFGPIGDCVQGAEAVNAVNKQAQLLLNRPQRTISKSCTRMLMNSWLIGRVSSMLL